MEMMAEGYPANQVLIQVTCRSCPSRQWVCARTDVRTCVHVCTYVCTYVRTNILQTHAYVCPAALPLTYSARKNVRVHHALASLPTLSLVLSSPSLAF